MYTCSVPIHQLCSSRIAVSVWRRVKAKYHQVHAQLLCWQVKYIIEEPLVQTTSISCMGMDSLGVVVVYVASDNDFYYTDSCNA